MSRKQDNYNWSRISGKQTEPRMVSVRISREVTDSTASLGMRKRSYRKLHPGALSHCKQPQLREMSHTHTWPHRGITTPLCVKGVFQWFSIAHVWDPTSLISHTATNILLLDCQRLVNAHFFQTPQPLIWRAVIWVDIMSILLKAKVNLMTSSGLLSQTDTDMIQLLPFTVFY